MNCLNFYGAKLTLKVWTSVVSFFYNSSGFTPDKQVQDHRGLLFPHLSFSLFITFSVISSAIKLNDESQDFSCSHMSFFSSSKYFRLQKPFIFFFFFFLFFCWQGDTKKTLAVFDKLSEGTLLVFMYRLAVGCQLMLRCLFLYMFCPSCGLSLSRQAGREGAQLTNLLAGGTSALPWQSTSRPISKEILMGPRAM